MKVIFMGTPDFAAKALESLDNAGHEIVLVVTQPDKEKGRGKQVSQSPVKEYAVAHNMNVFQPVKIREKENVDYLKGFEADICVVAAFGQILTEDILNMPKYGCVNIHASLLPKYRGAAPIQWSILNGEKQTGVTIMQMDKGLDTGDMLLQKAIDIEACDTGESLFDKLMLLGSELICEALVKIEKGELIPIRQNEEESTYAGKITKDMGLIDFSRDSEIIERYVRGLNSWPSAFTMINGKTLKIWKADIVKTESTEAPGSVIEVSSDAIVVKTGNGAISIKEIQLEGKKRMTVHDFLLGYKVAVGATLGK